MPFAPHPARAEPPKSRSLAPLTGIANKPLADAKAMAGLVRAGSFSAPKFGWPLMVAGVPCRLAAGAALAGRPRGRGAFVLRVLSDRALLALPLVDQGGEPGLVVREVVAVDRKP